MERRSPWLVDTAMVLVLAVLFFASAAPGDALGVLVALAYLGPLLYRRQFPLSVALITTAAYATWVLAGYPTHPLGALPAAVALYSLGDSEAAVPLKGLGVVALVTTFLVIAVGMTGMDPLEAAFFVAIFVGIWAVGVAVAGRRRYVRELEDRTRELETARSALADMAVREERARIARELHDVVSHSLSTITIQAGVGAHLAGTEPDKAAESLRVIETTGRATLEELRRVLGTTSGEQSERHPQPTIGDLEPLIRRVEDSGLQVEFISSGRPGPLPQIVELSVFRIIQESLTNAIKHSEGGRAEVSVDHSSDGVELEVWSDGVSARDTKGVGLKGMAERVALLGGEFSAGPENGRWRVWASIPGGEP